MGRKTSICYLSPHSGAPPRRNRFPALARWATLFRPPGSLHGALGYCQPRSTAVFRVIAGLDQIDIELVQQRGEPLLLPFPRRLAHTVQPLGHAWPVLCRWRVGLPAVLLGPRPSLPNLRRGLRPLCSAASLVLLCGPTSPLRVCPPCGFAPSRAALLSRQGQGRTPGSHACCCVACPGSQTTGDSSGPRADGPADVAFPCYLSGRHLHPSFRSSIPGPPVPLFTLRRPPRDHRRKTRGQDGSLSLSCRALSSPTTYRFIPARK